MQRRHFIKGAMASGATFATGSLLWLSIDNYTQPLTIQTTLAKLEGLWKSTVVTTGEWSLYQILIHCAQSVEYSMTGYPSHKADWFKASMGKLAFSAFSSKGRMHHPLSEPIPGAESITLKGNIDYAFSRLKQALSDFEQWQSPLAPHFAYGYLSKAEYEVAHAMHFNNHLQELRVKAN